MNEIDKTLPSGGLGSSGRVGAINKSKASGQPDVTSAVEKHQGGEADGSDCGQGRCSLNKVIRKGLPEKRAREQNRQR